MYINNTHSTLSLALLAVSPYALSVKAEAKVQPNVIFVLVDDLGSAELGCFGNKFNETPNIDKLAQQGIRFPNTYTAQTVSSPTRAALMTGLYPARTGISDYLRPDDSKHLSEDYTTMPEMFKSNGYNTCIVGKWHLTGYIRGGATYESSPDKHGFDTVISSENQGIADGAYFFPYFFNKDLEKKLTTSKEFLVDRLNTEASNYIDKQSKDKPFFLYLSHYAVHTEVHGKPEDVNYFRKKASAGKSVASPENLENDPYKQYPADYRASKNNPHLAAQLKVVDQGVGDIVAKLKEKGLYENTIIVFTSDNGGELNVTTNAPLRGGKSELYEGGIKVRAIVSAPALLPQGKVIEDNIVTYDFLPTFCEMLNIDKSKVSQKMDGVSLWSMINDEKKNLTPRTLYWNYPLAKRHFLGGRSSAAIQSEGWKLIQFYDTDEFELYNLKSDKGESKNLIHSNKEIAGQLKINLDNWRKDVGASTTVK